MHITHGSTVTYKVVFERRWLPIACAAARSARTSACAVGSCSATLALPAPASTRLPTTTTAPIGTSPRAPAAAASRIASSIQRRSASSGGAVRGSCKIAGWRSDCDRHPASIVLLGCVLGGRLASGLRRVLRGTRRALARGLFLTLLHVGLVDHHGLGHVRHRASGPQVLVHLLAVHRPGEPGTRRPQQQRYTDHQRAELHASASLRLRAAVGCRSRRPWNS